MSTETTASKLNAAAKEWKPPATSSSNPDVLLAHDFLLPPSNDTGLQPHTPAEERRAFDPHAAVYVFDEVTGEGDLVPNTREDGFDIHNGDDDDGEFQQQNFGGVSTAYPMRSFHPTGSYPHQQKHSSSNTGRTVGANTDGVNTTDSMLDAAYAAHAELFSAMQLEADGMPFVPQVPGSEGGNWDDVDWEQELKKFLAVQRELIEKQMIEHQQFFGIQPAAANGAATEVKPPVNSAGGTRVSADAFPTLQQSEDARNAAAFWSKGSTVLRGSGASGAPAAAPSATPSTGHYGTHPMSSAASAANTAASGAPLTVNGKHRWPKQTKAQQRNELAQKQAFEAFANALLHSTSPFMAPLRDLCKSSLPHLKLDQRFGKRGAPHTAVSQFIIAPLVVNYRPRHLHEVSPGDLLEFHYDLSQVLKKISTANCLSINYGPEWKPFAVPFCYLGCRDYKTEVLKLCPNEVPNSRSEAVYEDDVVKDITDLVLAIEELAHPLRKWSVAQCMAKRVNLAAMYDAFETIFAPIGNYQIQIRDLNKCPSQFLIKTSQQVLDLLPDKGFTGIVLHGDEQLWYDLPLVDNSFQSGKSKVVVESGAAAAAPPSMPDATGGANQQPSSSNVVKTTTGGSSDATTSTSTAALATKPRPEHAPTPTVAGQSSNVEATSAGPTRNSTVLDRGASSRKTFPAAAGSFTSVDYALIGVCVAAVAATVVVVMRNR